MNRKWTDDLKKINQQSFGHPGTVAYKEILTGWNDGFMKGKSCLSNLISFYEKMTRLVDEEKAVGVVYLDFSK